MHKIRLYMIIKRDRYLKQVIDKKKNEIIVKVINTLSEAQPLKIKVTGLAKKQLAGAKNVELVTLDCSDYEAENMPSQPEVVCPTTSRTTMQDGAITGIAPAKTLAVYKVSL